MPKKRRKMGSQYKSGISDTKYEGCFQNVKFVYKTGTSACNRPVIMSLFAIFTQFFSIFADLWKFIK